MSGPTLFSLVSLFEQQGQRWVTHDKTVSLILDEMATLHFLSRRNQDVEPLGNHSDDHPQLHHCQRSAGAVV
jgi:hypothetical protein